MRRPSAPAIEVIVLVVVVLLPAAYALSLGPACLLSDYGYIDPLTFLNFYEPLNYVVRIYPPLNDWLAWYVSFWSGGYFQYERV